MSICRVEPGPVLKAPVLRAVPVWCDGDSDWARANVSESAARSDLQLLFVQKPAARPLYVGANEMVQTSEFVRQQIEAMKSEVFELGLFKLPAAADGLDAGMLPRAWDSETLLRSIAWLRLENMRGRNIYIRPQGEHHLSLVDDLSKSAIDRMKSEGFQPAAIVETSQRNFQAWLNHGERLPSNIRNSGRPCFGQPIRGRHESGGLAPFRATRRFHQSEREAPSVERDVSLRAVDRIDR